MGSDAKGRAFLAGITWAEQRGGSADSSDKCMKSTRNVDSADGFVQPVEDRDSVFTTWSNSLVGEGREVPVDSHTVGGRMSHSTGAMVEDVRACERMSADSIQQTHPSVINGHRRSYLPLRSTIHEQSFYHQQSSRDSGDVTCTWERGRTPWDDVMSQQHRMEQLVIYRSDVAEVNTACRPTPWTYDCQSNDELLSDLTYSCVSVPFSDAGESISSSNDCWSGTEMMAGDWFNANHTNPISVCSFGSIDRSQPHSSSYQ